MIRRLSAESVEAILTRSLAGEHAFDVPRVGTIYPVVYPDRVEAFVSGVRQPLIIERDA